MSDSAATRSAATPNDARRGLSLAELGALVSGQVVRAGAPELWLSEVAPLDRAGPRAVGFVGKSEYLDALATTQAGAVLVGAALASDAQTRAPASVALVVVEQPYAAFAHVAQRLAPEPPRPRGIHATAIVDPTATLEADVALGPYVVVGARVRIGAGAVLHAGTHVHDDATIGAGATLHDHVVVRHACHVGERAILHAGVVVGADGFGFAAERRGERTVHVKIPQLGAVVIEDDVELGANTCVDRGALGTTRVGRGTKADNLVQIGHNVDLGPDVILVAQSGVAGSTKLGANVILGAQSGIAGHLTIGERVTVLGQAGVMHHLAADARVAGTPAVDAPQFFRGVVRIGKLDALAKSVRALEKAVVALRAGRSSQGKDQA